MRPTTTDDAPRTVAPREWPRRAAPTPEVPLPDRFAFVPAASLGHTASDGWGLGFDAGEGRLAGGR